jgi:hypothetical protein
MDGRQYVRDWGGGLVPMIGRLRKRKAKVEIDEMGCIESSGRGSICFTHTRFNYQLSDRMRVDTGCLCLSISS